MARNATASDWQHAAHQLADRHPVAEALMDRHGPPRMRPRAPAKARFEALASSIAYQQLAGRAAAAIWSRVVSAVGNPFTPEAVLALDPDELRGCGLSGSKVLALRDLATKCDTAVVKLDRIARLDDGEVIEHLTVVRGIGPWTAQMFLIFDLGRLDVWPAGDLGVRSGFGRAFDLDSTPTEREIANLGDPFSPYRSVLAWWCWREAETVGGRV